MHPNPAFRKTSQGDNIDFARQRSFGVLAVNSSGGPLISHIPFQLSQDGTFLEAHLVRSNPIVKLLARPQKAVMAVSGADAYISPDWYGVENQVPTWNYVAVHLRGTLRLLEKEALRGVLDRLSQDMERRLAPKPEWKLDKVDADIYAKLSRQVVPVAMDVEIIDGTWKLAQNKPEEARAGAADQLSKPGIGLQTDEIARLMR